MIEIKESLLKKIIGGIHNSPGGPPPEEPSN